eukprot:SAG11_NODE_15331_length_581_cov_2.950207_1_plen_157_part_10
MSQLPPGVTAPAKRTTRKVASSKSTCDRWGLDLSHFEVPAQLKEHVKGLKASELRHLEKWCSLSHDGLLGERRERFLLFIDASFEHAQLAYCCYFWDDMVSEINDLRVTLGAVCLDSDSPKAEHLDADILHGLAHSVGLKRGDSIPPELFSKISTLQ